MIEENVYIVTNNGVSLFDGDKIKEVSKSNFIRLYPNSIVVSPLGNIVIGMRRSVVRFRKTKQRYIEDWLID